MIGMTHEEHIGHLTYIDNKMYYKQSMKFKAFLLNIVLMLLVWLLCKSGMFDGMMTQSAIPAEFLKFQAMGWMALWKIANVVFFLVPAVAIWWERKCIEHHRYRLAHQEPTHTRRK